MFYCLKSYSFHMGFKAYSHYPDNPRDVGTHMSLGRVNFHLLEELWESRTWPHAKCYLEHKLPFWLRPKQIDVDCSIENLPDIFYTSEQWCVSEKVKNIIEKLAPLNQFVPVEIHSFLSGAAPHLKYFTLNVRLNIEVEKLPLTGYFEHQDFSRGYSFERAPLTTIEWVSELKQEIQKIALWKLKSTSGDSILFINQKLLDALRENKVEGIPAVYQGGELDNRLLLCSAIPFEVHKRTS